MLSIIYIKEGFTTVKQVLYNEGIFSGYQSLLALYLSGTPSLETGTRPPSCLQLSIYSHLGWLPTCYSSLPSLPCLSFWHFVRLPVLSREFEIGRENLPVSGRKNTDLFPWQSHLLRRRWRIEQFWQHYSLIPLPVIEQNFEVKMFRFRFRFAYLFHH